MFCCYSGKMFLSYKKLHFSKAKKGNIYLYNSKKSYSIVSADNLKNKSYNFTARTAILGDMSFGL